MSKQYKYNDLLTLEVSEEFGYIKIIKCELELLGRGANRDVFELPNNKCLKLARNIDASCINYDEINLYEKIKDKDCIIQFPKIYEYEPNWGLWYVCEKINVNSKAMKEAIELVPILDQGGENAGYNSKGQLTIIDAEELDYTWFLKETNPFA